MMLAYRFHYLSLSIMEAFKKIPFTNCCLFTGLRVNAVWSRYGISSRPSRGYDEASQSRRRTHATGTIVYYFLSIDDGVLKFILTMVKLSNLWWMPNSSPLSFWTCHEVPPFILHLIFWRVTQDWAIFNSFFHTVPGPDAGNGGGWCPTGLWPPPTHHPGGEHCRGWEYRWAR